MNRKRIRNTLLAAITSVSMLSGIFAAGMPAYANVSGTVTCTALNVRSGANITAAKVATIYKGQSVDIIEKSGDWYKINITVNGKKTTAYVSAEYVSTSQPVPAATVTGVVTADALNVRSTPSTTGSKLGMLSKNSKVTILETSGSWYKIKYGSVTGYVAAEYVKKDGASSNTGSNTSSNTNTSSNAVSGTGTVNVSALNVRTGPSTDKSKAGMVYLGQKVTLLEKSGSWYKISYGSLTGYVAGEYLTISSSNSGSNSSSETAMSATGTVNVSVLNVRKGPSTNTDKLGSLAKGAAVTITAKSGTWYKIKHSSGSAYVAAEYITVNTTPTKSEPAAPAETATNETVWATDSVNIRKGAGTNYSVITCLAKGKSIVRTAVLANGWSKVSYNGTTGYISSQYLTTTNPGSSSSSSGTSSKMTGQDIVNIGLKYVGYPYVYGGNDLDTGVDCSGFTQQLYLKAGYKLGRTADSQRSNGIHVSLDSLKPGDLIFYGSNNYAGHVALYMGNSQVVHASTPSTGIKISDINYREPIDAVRIIY